MSSKLPSEYFQNTDTLFLSRNLLGKYLLTSWADNSVTGGMIVETEAYMGAEDKASHAYKNRRTKRTEAMFHDGGICYVYLCYGIHHLFNIVTHKNGTPHAILIRALEPVEGIDIMKKRVPQSKGNSNRYTSGPGLLTKALGITTTHTGKPLTGPHMWLEDRKTSIGDNLIIAGPRIGVDYAKEDALKPWRFYIKNNPWVSLF